jgi:hypothetical protein
VDNFTVYYLKLRRIVLEKLIVTQLENIVL